TKSFANVSRITIPDPAATTTLGEALVVLNLAKKEMRELVFNKFEDRLPELAKLHLAAEPVNQDDEETYEPLKKLLSPSCDHFTLTRRGLGLSAREAPTCIKPQEYSETLASDEAKKLADDVTKLKGGAKQAELRIEGLDKKTGQIDAGLRSAAQRIGALEQ